MKNTKSKRYLIRKVSDYVGAFVLAFLVVFIWQLYRSPIPLPFLKPYIIKALNHDNADYVVTVDSVNLELVRSIQPIKIIAKDVSYKNIDDSISIKAPRTSISFSIRALLRGIISPSSVEVQRPTISIFTKYGEIKEDTPKNDINNRKIGYYFDVFEEFIDRFNSPDMSYPESYINEINIRNAELEIHEVDLGRKWAFSDANYIFDRHGSYIELGLDGILDLDDASVPFDFNIDYYPNINDIKATFSFSDLSPASIIDNFTAHENNFYKINIPVSGKIDMLIDFDEILANKRKVLRSLDTAITKFDFQFEGGNGNIAFSDKEEFNYEVSSFLLKGSLDSGLNNIKIENADFNLDDKKTTLGLNISGVKELLLRNSMKDLNISIKADIEKLPLSQLSRYWPRYIAEDAWLWVRDGIYDGFVSDASFVFDFGYDKKTDGLEFKNLSGKGYVNDASLNYLEGMPHAHNVYGTAVFYNDRIDIKIDKGVSNGNIVHDGRVLLYDLNKYDSFIDISLSATSSISDSLKLIDNPPFNYAQEMGLNPDAIEGDAETTLGLKFEFKKDLKPEEVGISVKSDLKNVKIKDIIKGKDVKAKKLTLDVSNKGLLVKGDIVLDDVDMNLEWNRSFKPPYKNSYRTSFVFDDIIKKKIGMDTELINKPYWYGNANVVANISEVNNRIVADIKADLKDSIIDYAFLGFVKAKNEAGKVNFKIDVVNGKTGSVKDILLAKEGFEVKANVELDKKGDVKVIDISSINGPKTNAKARIEMGTAKDPIKINISGNSYDISKLFDTNDGSKTISKSDKESYSDKLKKTPNMDINIAVNSLWTNKHVPVTNFAGNASLRKGVGVKEIRMIGNYSYKKDVNFKFEYLPRSNGDYLINVDSNDAGSTLKVLHIYDYMVGGELKISGRRDASEKVFGHAKIRNFNIKRTNLLSKMLSLASLTGILDMLRGDGIVFSHFDAPFTYKDGLLEIEDSKAFGNVLGITAVGYYNYDNGDLDIKGMIAPAYSINRFIGSIPLVGNLLSGKNDTVFAANYRAKGNVENNPDVNINTLSAISPNSIKNIFSSDK